jgi:hypothetical protein
MLLHHSAPPLHPDMDKTNRTSAALGTEIDEMNDVLSFHRKSVLFSDYAVLGQREFCGANVRGAVMSIRSGGGVRAGGMKKQEKRKRGDDARNWLKGKDDDMVDEGRTMEDAVVEDCCSDEFSQCEIDSGSCPSRKRKRTQDTPSTTSSSPLSSPSLPSSSPSTPIPTRSPSLPLALSSTLFANQFGSTSDGQYGDEELLLLPLSLSAPSFPPFSRGRIEELGNENDDFTSEINYTSSSTAPSTPPSYPSSASSLSSPSQHSGVMCVYQVVYIRELMESPCCICIHRYEAAHPVTALSVVEGGRFLLFACGTHVMYFDLHRPSFDRSPFVLLQTCYPITSLHSIPHPKITDSWVNFVWKERELAHEREGDDSPGQSSPLRLSLISDIYDPGSLFLHVTPLSAPPAWLLKTLHHLRGAVATTDHVDSVVRKMKHF